MNDRAGKMVIFFPVLPFCHFYEIGRWQGEGFNQNGFKKPLLLTLKKRALLKMIVMSLMLIFLKKPPTENTTAVLHFLKYFL